jgi:hypothetical protein
MLSYMNIEIHGNTPFPGKWLCLWHFKGGSGPSTLSFYLLNLKWYHGNWKHWIQVNISILVRSVDGLPWKASCKGNHLDPPNVISSSESSLRTKSQINNGWWIPIHFLWEHRGCSLLRTIHPQTLSPSLDIIPSSFLTLPLCSVYRFWPLNLCSYLHM